jgi:hypothetical protein
VGKVDDYCRKLKQTEDWDAYLLAESGLPGPRGNIELARAVAEEGDEATFRRYLAYDAQQAPANDPGEFLAFCGVLGLGKLLETAHAQGQAARCRALLDELRRHAADPRWRLREAVAMALQRLGRADMGALLAEAEDWAGGGPLAQRAAMAAVCEPGLLAEPGYVERVLDLLDRITASVAAAEAEVRRDAKFRALRKGLGYGWSVAVAAGPEGGKARMARWLESDDADVRWIMRQNLKKARLRRMDADWVAGWQERVQA